jgi:hypothetical protein
MQRRDILMHDTVCPHNRTPANAHPREHDAAGTEPGIVLDDDGTLRHWREVPNTGLIGVRRSNQCDPGSYAHPVTNGDVAPIRQLLHDEQIVCDVDVLANIEAAKPE